MFGAVFIGFLVFTSIPLSDGKLIIMILIMYIATWCCYSVLFLVLDPALIGLSLAYGVSLSNIVQYSVRLSAEVENLVRKYGILIS